jgi:phage terminase large subunit
MQVTYDVPAVYGANLDALRCKAPEVLLCGPAETGKTFAFLLKLHLIATQYEKASLVILRKTLTSTYSTVLITFQQKVLGDDAPVEVYGGEKPQWFDYPTKARIWVAGLDKSSRILSAEHDIVYVNQAEELTLDDWETLTTRTTGRAGHMPYSQTIGDANPSWPQHWMYQRESIERFYSWHKDNPTLFDPETGEATQQGEHTLSVLSQLTGLRRARLFEGRAVQAEGAVYDSYNPVVHLKDAFPIPADWRRFRAVDFGFSNPFVCQWWAMDGDGRMYCYREIYHTQRLVEDHARDIVQLSQGERIEATVCDHDAEDRATLERHGVPTVGAKKDISPGIQAVQARLGRLQTLSHRRRVSRLRVARGEGW